MQLHIRTAAAALAGILISGALQAREVSLDVSVNRDQIYIGESLQLTVAVSGTSTATQPDLSAIRNADVEFRGSHVQQSMQLVMRNGRVERDLLEERRFIYTITPHKTGALRIGPVAVETDEGTVRAPARIIQILGIEEQDNVIIEIESLRQSVLVGEPFEVTTTIFLRRLPPPYAIHNPLDPQNPPQIELDYIESAPIDGLEGPDIRDLLQERLVNDPGEPGFAINNYKISADLFGFGMLSDSRTARFMFPREAVVRKGKRYWAYTIRVRYLPTREASHTFGPAIFKGRVITGVERGGHARSEPIFAIGPALTVNVVPPPIEERPVSFIGAIGSNVTVRTSLDTQVCKVGDPLILEVDIGGDIRFENIFPPRLTDQATITNAFRIYDDTIKTEAHDGGRRYRYTIRPMRVGTYELPPVEVGYFDLGQRRYRVAASRPIPVKAVGAQDVDLTDVEEFATNNVTSIQLQVTTAGQPPAPITMAPAGAVAVPLVDLRQVILLAVAGPCFFIMALLVRSLHRARRLRQNSRPRRHAHRRAIQQLRTAGRGHEPAPLSAQLRETIEAYVSNRLCNGRRSGLTPPEVEQVLHTADLPEELVHRATTTYAQLFNEVYGALQASSADPAARLQTVRRLVDELEQAIATPQHSNSKDDNDDLA